MVAMHRMTYRLWPLSIPPLLMALTVPGLLGQHWVSIVAVTLALFHAFLLASVWHASFTARYDPGPPRPGEERLLTSPPAALRRFRPSFPGSSRRILARPPGPGRLHPLGLGAGLHQQLAGPGVELVGERVQPVEQVVPAGIGDPRPGRLLPDPFHARPGSGMVDL